MFYIKKLVANAVPARKVQKCQQNMLSTSLKVTSRLSDLVLLKLSQFVKFWSNYGENKVPVNQSNVLVCVNRAHPPSDQHWLFYERFSRDIKINGRVIK